MTPSSGCSNYDPGNCINIRCYGSFWSSLLQPVDGINVAFFTSCILRPILLLIMRMALYCSPQFFCFCHRLSSGSHRPIYTHTGIFSLSQLFLQTTWSKAWWLHSWQTKLFVCVWLINCIYFLHHYCVCFFSFLWMWYHRVPSLLTAGVARASCRQMAQSTKRGLDYHCICL